jgi:hypothetical protein
MRAPAALASLGAGPPPQHSSGHYGGASLDTERHADLTDFLRHLHSSALTLLPECNRCRRIRLKTNVDLDRRSVADSPLEEDGFGLAVPPRRERLWAATPGKHCRFGPEPVSGSAFGAAVSDWQRPEEPFAGAGPMVRIHLPPAESLSLSRIRFRRSRTPAFRAGVRGWLSERVGRDAQGVSMPRQPAAISLSGHIPVPQCR